MIRVVLKAPYEMVIEETTMPVESKGYAIIRVLVMGVCGTDIRTYKGEHAFSTYPRVLGHELVGEIVSISKDGNGKKFKTGDLVVVEPLNSCGTCYPCSVGRYNCCDNLKVFGVHIDGAMQEYMKVPIKLLHNAPDDVPLEELVMSEPLSIAYHGLARVKVTKNDTVALIGAGNIGSLALQILTKIQKVKTFALDISEAQLERARTLGAAGVVNSSDPGQAAAKIKELNGGSNPSVVVDAVGTEATFNLAINLASSAGRIVLIGICGRPTSIVPSELNRKELDIYGSRNSANAFPAVLEIVKQRVIDTGNTVKVPLTDAPSVFKKLANEKNFNQKVVFDYNLK
jgi:L-gulonate 5-dehydrogenase